MKDAAVPLAQGSDYTVDYSASANAGNTDVTVTVTVTGINYNGTFTQSFIFTQDDLVQPILEWNMAAKPVPVSATYTGRPVEESELPPVLINITSDTDLKNYLQYSYREAAATAAYTDGLPTNTGTYDVIVTLPGDLANTEGGQAASSKPIRLTVTPLDPIKTKPSKKTLTYNGSAQELATGGELDPVAAADGAVILFAASKDGDYSTAIPTGINATNDNATSYEVWYKVEATGNCKAVDPTSVSDVAIQRKKITPKVELLEDTYLYDGGEKKPKVTVRDPEDGTVLPDTEYGVDYVNNKNVSTETNPAKVVVTDKAKGNYQITKEVEVSFRITLRAQEALSITDKPNTVTYGDVFTLSTVGGSGNGDVTWSTTSDNVTIHPTGGQVRITGRGDFTIKATKSGTDPDTNMKNYEDATATWKFTAERKSVFVTVTAEDKVYDGETRVQLIATADPNDLVSGDTLTVRAEGHFLDADTGPNKTVIIDSVTSKDAISTNYDIRYPSTVTASIIQAAARVDPKPQAIKELTFNGQPQALVTAGSTVNNIGTIQYSLTQDGEYLDDVPEATNAGTYKVWFKVEGNENYTGVPASLPVEVEIKQAKPTIDADFTLSGTAGEFLNTVDLTSLSADVEGTFTWKDDSDSIQLSVGTFKYDAIFTPTDANYETVTFKITVTVEAPHDPSEGGEGSEGGETGGTETGGTETGGTETPDTAPSAASVMRAPTQVSASAPIQTSVHSGTATTVVSASAGSALVEEAAASNSQSVVIRPEIPDGVTRSEVSIPAATVGLIGSETDADLMVSTPFADVTVPSAALNTLSGAGGTVDIVTEQVEQTVVLTLTAGGETVEELPGGVTLAVPVEDAGPGTVAVLVYEDGTRETIRKSIVEDGTLQIPLSGSATVEIVDNSKSFSDVPDTSWAADAVAFASARELFDGTGEAAFSPDQTMSRAMLATALYNLEGHPAQSVTGEFSDVSGDAWYASSVSWAAENGIVNGYGDGQFGPDDDVTREQFTVMLWKYAGSPVASAQDLGFTDADQASDYALEALRWASANGILNGYGDGQLDPGGLITRAQAAQMLKNFLENS